MVLFVVDNDLAIQCRYIIATEAKVFYCNHATCCYLTLNSQVLKHKVTANRCSFATGVAYRLPAYQENLYPKYLDPNILRVTFIFLD